MERTKYKKFKMNSFSISVVFCILGCMVILASAQETSMTSRADVLSRLSTASRGTAPSFLSRGGDSSSPDVAIFSSCPASSGYFKGRKFKRIAKCVPTEWVAGGPFSELVSAPDFLKSEIYQSRTRVYPVLKDGSLGEDYVANTIATDEKGRPKIIGHVHWGPCNAADFLGNTTDPGDVGASTGAHAMYNTEQIGYGFDDNELWYIGGTGPKGQIKNYRGFNRKWGFPIDAGALPQFPGLARPNGAAPEAVGARGTQGNVAGSTVLHAVKDDGTTGVQWACCNLMYEKKFCDSIGGCKVFDKAQGIFVDADTY